MRRFLFCLFALLLILPVLTFGSTLPVEESNFRFAIDQVQSALGAEVELSIRNVSEPSKPGVGKGNAIASFVFQINYDGSKLELLSIQPGKVLIEQGWGDLAVATSIACTSGVVIDSGVDIDNCYATGPLLIQANAKRKNGDSVSILTRQNLGEWLVLKFKIKDDCTLSGQVLPVSWYWGNCSDNRLMNFPGNRSWVVDSLISAVGHSIDLKTAFSTDISNSDTVSFASKKEHVEKGITFVNGGIGIAHDECDNDRGDLNQNGVRYEIADYILYQNYFLYGDSVLFTDPQKRQGQIAASDVNGDDRTLRVADLVYLARVITGENYPLPKTLSTISNDTAVFDIFHSQEGLIISTFSNRDIGGAMLRLSSADPFGIPVKLDSAATLEINHNNPAGELRLLLSPSLVPDSSRIPAGKRQILFIPFKGRVSSVQLQVSTHDGQELPAVALVGVPAGPPRLENCPTEDTILYGRDYTADFDSDREGEPGFKYQLDGPGSIDSITGVYKLEAGCSPGYYGILIELLKEGGGPFVVAGYCKFHLIVIDHPPSALPEQLTVTVSHGQLATNKILASDPDSGDELLFYARYTLGQIDSTGNWTYQTSCRDVAYSPQTITVQVEDSYASCRPGPYTSTTSFQLVVTNAQPSIICPPNAQVVMGKPYQVQITAQDPDPADSGNLTFALVSGPAGLTVLPSGLIQWTPYGADIGSHTVHLRATDLCGASADCEYTITVIEGVKFRIAIDTVSAEQNADVEVSIRNLDDAADPTLANGQSVGGFSFLLSYDCSCLQLLAARKGALLVQQGWEYFTYRYGAVGNGNCGSGCPSCLIRVVAIADVNNGDVHPTWARENQGEWVVIKFRTTSDLTLAGQLCQINWYWFDCNDNVISDSTGQRLWTANALYSADGAPIDLATAFPINVSTCTTTIAGKPQPKKFIDFVNGGIWLPPAPYIEFRGDLNLNGINNEPADFELFKNYFAYGDVALYQDSVLRQLQIINSDVNGDGLTLDLSDLVMMARIITGDENPIPTGQPQLMNVRFTKEGQNLIVTTSSSFDLGGLFLRLNFPGTAGPPTKLDSALSMELATGNSDGDLRVLLVASEKDTRIPAGTQRVLSIPCDSIPAPVEVSACDYYGIALPTYTTVPANVEMSQQPAPTSFDLSQNFPNPFNPSTSFTLSLPKPGRYSVHIYNLAGQVVKIFEGEATAGRQTLTWDGKDKNGNPVSSGIYLYKAEANGFYQTKKMILIR